MSDKLSEPSERFKDFISPAETKDVGAGHRQAALVGTISHAAG